MFVYVRTHPSRSDRFFYHTIAVDVMTERWEGQDRGGGKMGNGSPRDGTIVMYLCAYACVGIPIIIISGRR